MLYFPRGVIYQCANDNAGTLIKDLFQCCSSLLNNFVVKNGSYLRILLCSILRSHCMSNQ